VVSKLLQQSRRVRFKLPSTTILTTRGRRKREKKGGNDAACTLGVTGGQRGVRKGCAQEEKKKKKTSCCVEKEREGESKKAQRWNCGGWKARRRSQLGLTSLCLASSNFPLHLHFLTSNFFLDFILLWKPASKAEFADQDRYHWFSGPRDKYSIAIPTMAYMQQAETGILEHRPSS
jgi:hypothetical protein